MNHKLIAKRTPNRQTDMETQLVNSIANVYFTGFHCVIIINVTNPPDLPKVTCTNSSCPNLLDFGCQGFIVSSTKILEDLEEQMKRSHRRFNNRRYLFVSPNQQERTEVFKLEVIRDIKDLLVVAPKGDVFELLTHKFTGDKTSQSSPVLLDRWFPENQSFAFNADLYPDKTRDLQGRTLILSTFTYKPYAMIGDSLEDSHGIEVRLISEYEKRRNFSSALRVRQDEAWGNIKLNGRGMGLKGAVSWGRSDIGFCGIYLWSESYNFVDFSAVIMRKGIKCLVPKPKQILGLLAAFDQFPLRIWLLILGTLLTSAFVLFLVQHLQNQISSNRSMAFGKIVLLVCGLFVTQSMPHHRVFRKVKAVFICVCLFCLIIDFSYSSNLASKLIVPRNIFMVVSELTAVTPQKMSHVIESDGWRKVIRSLPRKPRSTYVVSSKQNLFPNHYFDQESFLKTVFWYERGIETSQDLADSNLKWIGVDKAYVRIFRAFPEPRFQKFIKNCIEQENLAKLKKWTLTGKFVIPVVNLESGNYVMNDFIDNDVLEKLKPMKEEVHWMYTAIILKRNSVFLKSLDTFILRVLASGLMSPWESQAIVFNSSLKLQNMLKSSSENQGQVELKFRHVRGIFAAWILGLALSTLVFIYEIFK